MGESRDCDLLGKIAMRNESMKCNNKLNLFFALYNP